MPAPSNPAHQQLALALARVVLSAWQRHEAAQGAAAPDGPGAAPGDAHGDRHGQDDDPRTVPPATDAR